MRQLWVYKVSVPCWLMTLRQVHVVRKGGRDRSASAEGDTVIRCGDITHFSTVSEVLRSNRLVVRAWLWNWELTLGTGHAGPKFRLSGETTAGGQKESVS